MKKVILAALLVTGIILPSCTTIEPNTFELNVEDVISGKANVVIRREARTAAIFPATIYIDGQKVGTLENGSFFGLSLPPGTYSLTIDLGLLSGVPKSRIDVIVVDEKVQLINMVIPLAY